MRNLRLISAASPRLSFMLLLAGIWIFAGCNRSGVTDSPQMPESTLQRIQREKTLRVAYIDYPPAVFRDPHTGQMKGQFVDTLEEILRQLDPQIKVSYEETNWADFGVALNTHRVDLSIAGTFATVPRAKNVSFTRPLVYLGRSVIVRRGDSRFSPTKGPSQFDRNDVRVGVVEGEGSHEYVKENFKNLKNVVVFSGSDLSQCLLAVLTGQVDVGMSDALETSKFVRAHPHEVVDLYATNPYDLTPISWAVRQDDFVWKNFLDTAIDTLETQGKLAEFENRYDFRWSHKVIEFSQSGPDTRY
jgi:ABC-type amino acid transport substrate-binding protein